MNESAAAAKSAAEQTAGAAKEEAAGVAAVAASAAGDVAVTAREQTAAAAHDTLGEARELFDHTRSQVEEQASVVAHKLGDGLRSLAGELRDLGEGRSDGSGQAAGLARSIAERGDQVAELLTRRGPNGIVEELRSFAGRKPGTFLLGALAAGIVAGRFTRGVRGDTHTQQGGSAPDRPASPSITPPLVVDLDSESPPEPLRTGYGDSIDAAPLVNGASAPSRGSIL